MIAAHLEIHSWRHGRLDRLEMRFREVRQESLRIYSPTKKNMLNPKIGGFVDVSPFPFGGIFRFQPFSVVRDSSAHTDLTHLYTHEFSAKYTAVRTHGYIQQTHSACTDEALVRVYR